MLDKAEFKGVFDNYFDSIRGFVYYRCGDAEAASDIAQDVFMRVWEKRGQLERDNIKPLLYKMANDMLISVYRKGISQLNFMQYMVVNEGDEGGISPQDVLQYEELKRRYADVLNKMTGEQREVFLMNRNEELTYYEIAERLGISVKAVEKRMSVALKLLKSKLL